jgi:hypothetical protein
MMTCWSCGDGLMMMFDLSSPDASTSHLCAGCDRRWASMSRHPSVGTDTDLTTAPFPLLERRPASVN